MHKIGYNSQRNNFDFAGKFPGWTQCFSTCAWMFMSFYSGKVVADDDKGLAQYVDDVEASVGKPGIAEKVMRKIKFITGKTSLWWAVQREGIESWLWRYGIKGTAIFRDQNISFDSLGELLKAGPVILGTTKMGKLPGGHIILAIGETPGAIICHDPYGDAKGNYVSQDGQSVEYPKDFLRKYTGEKIRCIYWIR